MQSVVYYEITSSALVGNNSLMVELAVSDSVILESVSISYIVINAVEFTIQNNLKYDSFALNNKFNNFTFQPL